MKICVCHATKGFDFRKHLYDPIRRSDLNARHEFVLPHEDGTEAHTKARIESCDLVVADVSMPSTGTGIELGWANAAGVPIVCVHRKGSDPSGALKHVARDIVGYDGPDGLSQALESLIER